MQSTHVILEAVGSNSPSSYYFIKYTRTWGYTTLNAEETPMKEDTTPTSGLASP